MFRYLVVILLSLFIAPAAFASALSWEVQVSGTTVNLNGITAISSSTAIAVGEDFTILKTTNYGQTWTAKTTPNVDYDLKAVYFPSALVGYAVGRNPSANAGFCYKTTDGGETWVLSSTGISVANSSGLYDVHFVNDNYGFACGHHASASGVVKTIDGGVNWTTVSGGPGGNTQYNSVFFTDVNNGCLVGAQGKIYTTTNGGTIWTAPVSGVTNTLNDVFFLDANNGWIAGNVRDFGSGAAHGLVLKSINGGNWSLIDSGLSDGLAAIQFVSTSDGWAAGFGNNANIAKSTNGGVAESWSYDKQVSSNTGLNDLNMHDSINGWAVGNSGLILHRPSALTVTSVSPATANQGETINLTINGTNFLSDIAASGITFSTNGITVNSLTYVDETQIIVNMTIAASATIGTRNITVANSNGQTATAINVFSVNPTGVTPPTITSISPTNCAQAITTDITITGSNVHPSPTVAFSSDGITVNSVARPDSTTINVNITTTATATASWRAVTVQNSDDSGITTKNNFFKINSSPTITSVLPNSGYVGNTNLPIYITGDNFENGATLAFNAASGASVAAVDVAATASITINTHEVVDANAIRASISLATASTGLYSLTLTNPDHGQATLANCYTVNTATLNPEIVNQRGLFLPNPWNPNLGTVDMQFFASKAATLTFIVSNIAGRKIASFTRSVTAGQNTITIDRSMFPGHALSNGILLFAVISDHKVIAKFKLTVQFR
jgi:photosystem II stability/assembly factor-like uncharacterized protein